MRCLGRGGGSADTVHQVLDQPQVFQTQGDRKAGVVTACQDCRHIMAKDKAVSRAALTRPAGPARPVLPSPWLHRSRRHDSLHNWWSTSLATSPLPVTGASTACLPRAETSAARSRIRKRKKVVMSIQSVPVQSVARKPSGPRSSCSTSFGPKTTVTTTSQRASTSAALWPASVTHGDRRGHRHRAAGHRPRSETPCAGYSPPHSFPSFPAR